MKCEVGITTFAELERACLVVVRCDDHMAVKRFCDAARNIVPPDGKKLPPIPVIGLPWRGRIELFDEAQMNAAGWFRKGKS